MGKLAPQALRDQFGAIAEQFWVCEHNRAPKWLYHYSSTESIKKIIEHQQMWASSFECMNDNEEFRKGMELAEEEIVKFIGELPLSLGADLGDNFKKFIQEQKKNPKLRPFVLSFSGVSNNNHLWEKYADEKKGCTVKLERELSYNNPISGYLVKVVYDEKSALVEFKKNIKKLTKVFEMEVSSTQLSEQISDLLQSYLQTIFKFSVTLKDSKWSDEKEWRLVVFADYQIGTQHIHGDIKDRLRNDKKIDYLQIQFKNVGLKAKSVEAGEDFDKSQLDSLISFLMSQDISLINGKNKYKLITMLLLVVVAIIIFFQNCAPQGSGGGVAPSGIGNTPPPNVTENCIFDTSEWDGCLWQ